MARFTTIPSLLLLLFLCAAVALVDDAVWLGLCLLGLTGAGVWRLAVCHHPRPLALLPPTPGPDGERRPPQWFCAACGRTWPAHFDHPDPPLPGFKRRDESKPAIVEV
jgi:hypothetical protein